MSSLRRLSRPITRLSQQPLHIRSITSTPRLSAEAKPKAKSSDGPKVKQQKGGNKTKTPSASQSAAKEAHSTKMERLVVAALDAPYIGPPKASEEEMAKRYEIGRNYVIGCWEAHNELNHDLAVKIRMKRYAIKMLPKENQLGDSLVELTDDEGKLTGEKRSTYGRWREEALKINEMSGPPGHRPIPMYTPPIPGFDIEQYMDEEEDES